MDSYTPFRIGAILVLLLLATLIPVPRVYMEDNERLVFEVDTGYQPIR